MKTAYSFIIFSLLLISCNSKEVEQKQKTIDSISAINSFLQNEIKELKKENTHQEKEILSLSKTLESQQNIEAQQNKEVRSSSKYRGSSQDAINAIKYELKMYHPDTQIKDIRAVSKTNGSFDVIVDYYWTSYSIQQAYYNVTTSSNGSYKIHKEWGVLIN